MTSLQDIAPARETVTIGATGIECRGASMTDIVKLLSRYPALLAFVFGRGKDAAPVGLTDVQGLIQQVPEAIGPLIAAGTGNFGDADEERAAAELPAETQIDLLIVITRLTLPNGFGPFVEKLSILFGIGGEAGDVENPIPPRPLLDGESRPRPNGAASTEPLQPQ